MPFWPSFSAFPGRRYCPPPSPSLFHPFHPRCSRARNKTARPRVVCSPGCEFVRRSRCPRKKNRATNHQTNHLLSIIAKVTFFSLRRRAELKIWKYGRRTTVGPRWRNFSVQRSPSTGKPWWCNSFRPRETRPKGSRWSAFRISTYLLIAARSFRVCSFCPSPPRDNAFSRILPFCFSCLPARARTAL